MQLAAAQTLADHAQHELSDARAKSEVYRLESEGLRTQLAGSSTSTATVLENTPSSALASAAADSESQETGGMMKSLAKMYSDPEMRQALRSQQAMGIQMMYGDLAKELGLSPEEAARVMELLTDRQMEMTSAGMELLGDGNEQKLAEAGKSAQAKREQYDSQLKQLLGPERAQRLENYERTMGERMQMQQYQASFTASGVPLADNQREALLKIMGEERLKAPRTVLDPANKDVAAQMKALQAGEGFEELVAQQREINQRVLARAHTVLSPDQMNAFESAQKAQLSMQEMGMKMGRQFLKGAKK
jgi:hypothetical protein